MNFIQYPLPGCGFVTDDVEDIAAPGQLKIHALVHQSTNAGATSTSSDGISSNKVQIYPKSTSLDLKHH